MAQWLACGALPMSLPAMFFRIPLGAGFAGDIMFLPSRSWDIVKMLCPYWARSSDLISDYKPAHLPFPL